MSFWEVVIEGRQGTKDMLNVVHYENVGSGTPDFSFFASAVRGHLADHIATFCGDWVTWIGLTVREDIVGSVGVFVPFPGGDLAGTNATPSQMASASMLVRKLGVGLVRPTKGWAFQGGLVVDGLDATGRWELPVRAAVNAYWEDIRESADGLNTDLRMVIKARNPLAPNTQPYTVVGSVNTGSLPSHLDTRKESVGS